MADAVNPLISAAHPGVYSTPMVLLIGWRGAPGTKDEPQHRVMGEQTDAVLEAIDVPRFVLPPDDEGARAIMQQALQAAVGDSRPVAVLAPPKTFTGTKAVASVSASATRPTREQAVAAVVQAADSSDAVVSTTGYTSRELYEMREQAGQQHSSDFLTVGSMGHALAIAQGIALAQPERVVWCLDGDGAALMHLGSMAMSARLPNLRHVLLDNGVHDSVGGQPTVATQGGPASLEFAAVAAAAGYASVSTVATPGALRDTLAHLDEAAPGHGASFVHVRLAPGTRSDLGRPKTSPVDAKEALMGFLRDAPSASRRARAAAATTMAACSETGDPLLFTPGPLTTSRSVKEAMMHDYGSRDERFIRLTAKVREQILGVLEGAPPSSQLVCVPLQGSGTYAVEAMLSQFVGKSDKLLILANGAYGRRMADIASRHCLPHEVVETAEDLTIDAAALTELLEARRDVTHVAVVHCETTTGILNQLAEIAGVVHASGRRLLVDAMSSFGILPLEASMPFDAIAASSNKGLEGAPGVGFVITPTAVLEEAKDNADTAVLDLHAQWKGLEANGQWRFTPPTHVMLALGQALQELEAEGGAAGRRQRYAHNCAVLVEGMRALGFQTLLPDGVQAPTIVTFKMPQDKAFVFDEFYNALAAKGFVIYPGKLAAAPSFRVGCIGRIGESDMHAFLNSVKRTLEDMGVKSLAP